MKKIAAAILAVMLASVLLISSVCAVDFSDTASHWAKNSIAYLSGKQILNGYEDGTFRPDATVTRAEFIKMMTETFGLTETAYISFADVSTTDWFYDYVSKAKAQGFLLDYGYSMEPNSELTRAEAAALLARYLGLTDAVDSSKYPDYYEIPQEYRTYVLQATAAGLFNGYQDGTFGPARTLTRAEALTILYRAAGAVYTVDTNGIDSGAYESNASVTKGGITISDATISGNVYVTEGTSDTTVVFNGCMITGTVYVRGSTNVTFTDCRLMNVVVEPTNGLSALIRVYGDTTIYNMSVASTYGVEIDHNAEVSELVVEENAPGTKITGAGKLTSLKVNSVGIESAMVPEYYTIPDGYTALFAGVEYTSDGPAYVKTGFVDGYPYIDETSKGYAYMTYRTEEEGTIYYVLIDEDDETPSAQSIRSSGYSINVGTTREDEDDLEYKYSKLNDSHIAAVFYDDDGNAYAPVRVFRSEESGFLSAYVRGSGSGSTYTAAYSLRSQAAGKAYVVAYRSDEYKSLKESSIISYATNENATKYMVTGIIDMPEAGDTYTLDLILPSSYHSYEWETAVVFVSVNGVQQSAASAEISSSKETLETSRRIEGNGFIDEPELVSGTYSYPYTQNSNYDVVSYETEADGRVYYYYTNTKTAPEAEDFEDVWDDAYYGSYFTAVGEKSDTEELYYNKTTVSSYSYIVFSFVDEDGNYYEPVVVERSGTGAANGFSGSVTFTQSGNYDYLVGTPLTSGTLYYYYTSNSSYAAVSNYSDFMAYYNSVSTVSGNTSVSTTSSYIQLQPSAYVSGATYIVAMLVPDNSYGWNATSYPPFYVSRSGGIHGGINGGTSTSTGFLVTPQIYSDPTTGYDRLWGYAQTSGTVYWYYTNSSSTPTVSDFLYAGNAVSSITVGSDGSIAGNLQWSILSSSYVAIMLVGENGTYYQPVLLSK